MRYLPRYCTETPSSRFLVFITWRKWQKEKKRKGKKLIVMTRKRYPCCAVMYCKCFTEKTYRRMNIDHSTERTIFLPSHNPSNPSMDQVKCRQTPEQGIHCQHACCNRHGCSRGRQHSTVQSCNRTNRPEVSFGFMQVIQRKGDSYSQKDRTWQDRTWHKTQKCPRQVAGLDGGLLGSLWRELELALICL